MLNTKFRASYPVLFAWAILCFVPTLFYFYVGEEAVYTLNSIEMWQRREYMDVVMYGLVGGRPPLYAWLTIPMSIILGWENVLMASRIVAIAATVGTSLTVAWLAHQLWRNSSITWIVAILYLATADILLYRGWLSYADPLFAFFVVLAMAQTWVACRRESYALLAVAMFFAFAAFLTKALTVYVFLGTSLLVLFLHEKKYRQFLLHWKAWASFGLVIVFHVLWTNYGTQVPGQSGGMMIDISKKLHSFELEAYLVRLISYPAEMWVRLMPATFVITYFLAKKGEIVQGHPELKIALWIALINFLPYLLAPEGSVRYVLPIYAFLILVAGYLIAHESSPFKPKKWLVVMLLIGTLMNTFAFPAYQKAFRGENYALMAKVIVTKYGAYPLYITNYVSTGISVAAEINTLRRDTHLAITEPPDDFENGIVITYKPDDMKGTLLGEISLNGDVVYLICRGAACNAPKI